MARKVDVSFSEVPVGDVAAFFVKGYAFEDGVQLLAAEHYYDPHRGVFVFKLTTERDAPEGGAE